MAVSDNRITIRNKLSGELGHGIAGHVPAGFEEVKAGKSDEVPDRDMAKGKAGNATDKEPAKRLQVVRDKASGSPIRGILKRAESKPK